MTARPEWEVKPVPYGQQGWAGQLESVPDDYVANDYQPSAEYEWRAARRRPEFQDLVDWAYAQPDFHADLDYWDWGNDEASEAMVVAGAASAEAIEAEAKSRGFGMEWGGEDEEAQQKVWLQDPVAEKAFPRDYSVYTMRSLGAASGETGE